MLAASRLFLAGLCPAFDSGVQSVAPTGPAPQTQGPMSPIQNVGGPLPSGGTPEPATILLLVGGALGYGANRLRRARQNRHESGS